MYDQASTENIKHYWVSPESDCDRYDTLTRVVSDSKRRAEASPPVLPVGYGQGSARTGVSG